MEDAAADTSAWFEPGTACSETDTHAAAFGRLGPSGGGFVPGASIRRAPDAVSGGGTYAAAHVSGTGAFALAGNSAPRTPLPPVPPPVLSRLSQDTYAFGNEQMGYFYIPSASLSLGDAAGKTEAKSLRREVETNAESRTETSPTTEKMDARSTGASAASAASSASSGAVSDGTRASDPPIPRAVLDAAAAAAAQAAAQAAAAPFSPLGARTPPVPAAAGAGLEAYSPGFNPALALGFSPFVPPSPGPYSPVIPARFPEPADPAAGGFPRAAASASASPARAPSFLAFAANAMARTHAGAPETRAGAEGKASAAPRAAPPAVDGDSNGEGSESTEARAREERASPAEHASPPPAPPAEEARATAKSSSPGLDTPGSATPAAARVASLPGEYEHSPAPYGYALPASLSASPQAAAAAAYAYEAEYASAMRAWSLANPEVSRLAERLANAASPRSSNASTPPTGGAGSPVASPAAPNAADAANVAANVACARGPFEHSGPLRFPFSPLGSPSANASGGVHASYEGASYAADAMYPPSPPAGWFSNADAGYGSGYGSGPGAVPAYFAPGGAFGAAASARPARPFPPAPTPATCRRNGPARNHVGRLSAAAARRGPRAAPSSPLAGRAGGGGDRNGGEARALADRAGLGAGSGAVLVGSGGDGLGEAARGPRAAAAAATAAAAARAAAAAAEAAAAASAADAAREKATVANSHEKSTPVVAEPNSSSAAVSGDADRATLPAASSTPPDRVSATRDRKARAGVVADPEFRDAVWRRAERSGSEEPSEGDERVPEAARIAGGGASCDRFDGAGLEGLDFTGRDRFFVIKSYTEDDVHKSVKYGCWTSTSTGNARLDAAYSRVAPERGGGDADEASFLREESAIIGGTESVDAAFLEIARKAERALSLRRGSNRAEAAGGTNADATRADGAPLTGDAGVGERPGASEKEEACADTPDDDFDDDALLRSPSASSADDASAQRPEKKAQTGDAAGDAAPAETDDARVAVSDGSDAPDASRDAAARARARAERSGGAPRRPRVVLLFSVNSSGHFCGVAEMIGAVDHAARADFWQRDKWPGCFRVRWHYVKDVPNAALRHIRLVESDRKPVTNARDAQEVAPSQARLVLNVFRNFRSDASLLDDFEFYGAREKARADVRRARAETCRDVFGANGARPVSFTRRGGSKRAPAPVPFLGSRTTARGSRTTAYAAEYGGYGGYGVTSPFAASNEFAGSLAGSANGFRAIPPFPFPASGHMSASAPAFAPAFAPASSRRAVSASPGAPYGTGEPLPPEGPGLRPPQPEKRATEASPYRDAVGAR